MIPLVLARLSASVVLILGVVCTGCTTSPDWAPDLSDAELYMFLEAPDPEFQGYVEGLGYTRVGALWPRVSPDKSSFDAFQRSLPRARTLNLRLATAVETLWGESGIRRLMEALFSLPAVDYWEWIQLADRVAVAANEWDPLVQVGYLHEIEEGFARLPGDIAPPGLYGELAQVYGNLAQGWKAIAYERRAVAQAERIGSLNILCQSLGVLGVRYAQAGYPDSATVYYQRFRDVAVEHGLAAHQARYSEFMSNLQSRRGHNTAALDAMREANEPCRIAGDDLEIRFLLNQSRHHARLGCWDLVLRESERVSVLCGNIRSVAPVLATRYALTAEWEMARREMALGSVEVANAMFSEVRNEIRFDDTIENYWGSMASDWALGLIQRGQSREAIRITLQVQDDYRGREYTASPHHANLAVAYREVGLSDSAWVHLARFRELHPRDVGEAPQWDRMAALTAGLHLDAGDTLAALDSLRAGLSDLEDRLSAMDASAWSYLVVEGCRAQRDLLHEILADHPTGGLAVERQWRRIYSHLGTGAAEGVLSACVDLAAEALKGKPGTPAIPGNETRVLFYVSSRGVVRWTETGKGVVRDALVAPLTRFETRIRNCVAMLGKDPGPQGVMDPGLVRELHALAQGLLPPAVLGSSGGRLIVTPDAWIRLLPFEALSVDPSAYQPLIATWSVVYRRSPGRSAPSSSDLAGIVVSDPRASSRTRRAFGGVPELFHGQREAARVVHARPNTAVLGGKWATRDSLLAVAETPAYLYYVGHVLRDREYPYLPAMLLAPGDSAASDDLVYPRDVRSGAVPIPALVVLSGCSSGAPYVQGRVTGPALGDTFLDAGASQVIQTVWDVGDAESARLMDLFVEQWGEGREPVEIALTRAKRALLAVPDSAHPYNWAAYILQDRGD